MAKIVAARLNQAADTEAVLKALANQGFKRTEFQSFYVNPAGQHARYPIGGDAHSDEGARRAGHGTVYGAVIGGIAGTLAGYAASVSFGNAYIIVAGAAVGAYAGSLVGALSRMKGGDKTKATPAHPVERAAGQMVAVCVDRPGTEPRAVETLTRYGAREIERTEGTWRGGDWKDFDPRASSAR
ncbi:MAG TPA: hypothetical protein VJQ51_11715 [Burkholderiales bacterium]|nr:hypothetical protein [Burkholderiales bacterium]